MDFLQQSFTVSFEYKVCFTENLFSGTNPLLNEFLKEGYHAEVNQKILFVIDQGVADHHPLILQQIDQYFYSNVCVQLVMEKVMIPGGEIAKNEEKFFKKIVAAINQHGVDRHSYVAAIGGGAVLDLVGYAAAVSHRGIRHIRIPTTVLAQNDSGVGVKNAINYEGKKNFLGTFAPPAIVLNDFHFLNTLPDRHWRSGISEAVKVALIRDAVFFDWLEEHAQLLAERDMNAMQYLVRRCAALHLQHISHGGDPFELGSSRPLDFGHWSAHKLEQISNFTVLHGEAVSIGIALDTIYSNLSGRLSEKNSQRIIRVLLKMGLPVTHPMVTAVEEDSPLLRGLQEFREHLGGQLTIMLLKDIGEGIEVHEMDPSLIKQAAGLLQNMQVLEYQF